jgi:hypothetical protein
VLARLKHGESVDSAVQTELARNPLADAGVIAVDRHGQIALGNTAFVAQRDDAGAAELNEPDYGLRAAVLHNAIFPRQALAALVLSVALDTLVPGDGFDLEVPVTAGMTLELGEENCLHLSPENTATKITVTQNAWLGERWDGAVLMRGASVRRDDLKIGRVVLEPYCVAERGRLISMSGRDRVNIKISTS